MVKHNVLPILFKFHSMEILKIVIVCHPHTVINVMLVTHVC